MRVTLGGRVLLAASCLRCGVLFPGSVYRYRVRNHRDKAPYVDQRCTNCKWGTRVRGKSDGRDSG